MFLGFGMCSAEIAMIPANQLSTRHLVLSGVDSWQPAKCNL
jgi:hypothetical protein